MSAIPTKMTGAILPGNSTLELKQFDVPEPGHGEVLLRTKASTGPMEDQYDSFGHLRGCIDRTVSSSDDSTSQNLSEVHQR